MAPRTRIGSSALLVAACLATAGCGSIESRDERAARAFLTAVHELEAAAARDAPQEQKAVRQLLARVRADCPGVLSGAPADGGPLRREAVAAIGIARRRPVKAELAHFIGLVRVLSFTHPDIKVEADKMASDDGRLAALPQPNLCADARAYMLSRGKTLPAGTRRLFKDSDGADRRSRIAYVPLAEITTLRGLTLRYESAGAWLHRAAANARLARKLLGGAPEPLLTERNQLLSALGLRPEQAQSSTYPGPSTQHSKATPRTRSS